MEKFIPNAPLFQDPIYDGAADPVVIWNHNEQAWWMFYTNRRASEINHGVSYMHGINYPVIEQNTNAIWQTSMNIDQLVLPDSVKMNMNREYFDLHSELNAGFWNIKDKIVVTAFNPEGAPGSHDADEIFDYFLQMME